MTTSSRTYVAFVDSCKAIRRLGNRHFSLVNLGRRNNGTSNIVRKIRICRGCYSKNKEIFVVSRQNRSEKISFHCFTAYASITRVPPTIYYFTVYFFEFSKNVISKTSNIRYVSQRMSNKMIYRLKIKNDNNAMAARLIGENVIYRARCGI